LLIVGPCSIHDLKGGHEYAERLANLAAEVRDRVLIVMRVYFEKPRTTVGWKGLIMDPHLDGTNDIPAGLRIARRFLRDVLDLGLPTATEMLDPITPQYIADLTCWTAIGARTTESQTHRQMASGLSMPVGFKNTTSGAVTPAINAIKAAMQRQTFLGIDESGRASVVNTTGNPDCHVILRGGDDSPNHDAASVAKALGTLEKAGLPAKIMVDASHANCAKECVRMPATFREILAQRAGGAKGIIGAMLESNLVAGAQSLGKDCSALVYGQSITDQCIDWETTETLVREAAQ
jgi:3-deoxy-7-phosphoheptulonate synthase